MFGPSVNQGYRVPPKSTHEIRRHAVHVRGLFEIKNGFFPMAEFIESLTEWGITYDVVDRDQLPQGVEACCNPESALIQFSAETYDQACRDAPRARFTVIHELGHLALSHARGFHKGQQSL